MPLKKLAYQVQIADEGRIDALVARLLQFSRARVRGLVDHGGVSLNGAACEQAGELVQTNDQVELSFDPERKYREAPAERATHGYKIVYVDDHLVVVNKDAGLLTVPTDRGEDNTLIRRLSTHLAKGRRDSKLVSVIHRLDRETSGLLVFGRTLAVAQRIIGQFAAHKPEREYAALVSGRVSADADLIRSHLATDKALNQKSVSGLRGPQGQLAVTHFEVAQRFADATLITVRLETGRRNQIRVHFAELGHPVLGDERYSAEQATHRAWPHARLALHARLLGFQHPMNGKPLRFTAELPNEFRCFIKDQAL